MCRARSRFISEANGCHGDATRPLKPTYNPHANCAWSLENIQLFPPNEINRKSRLSKTNKIFKKKKNSRHFRNGHAEKRETSIMEALKVPQPCSVQILPMISHESQRVSTCRISFARGFSQDKHRRQSTSKNVARPAFENDRRQPAFSSLLLLPEIFHRLSNSLSYISIFHVNGTRESIIILRRVYDESTN